MATEIDFAEEVQSLRELLKRQQYRMRVYLFIFGILIMCVGGMLYLVLTVAQGAKDQSVRNHKFGETNRGIICYNASHVAHGDPLPEGC